MIWAQSRDGIIGDGLRMPWHLSEDLAHFKKTTLGAPVIMGRATWDSLGPKFRPLPGRRNIVLSRTGSRFDGAEHAASLEAALDKVANEPTAWIIGGGHIYREALAKKYGVNECIVTEIDITLSADQSGDPHIKQPVYAPDLEGWRCDDRGSWQTATNGLRYRFQRWIPDR